MLSHSGKLEGQACTTISEWNFDIATLREFGEANELGTLRELARPVSCPVPFPAAGFAAMPPVQEFSRLLVGALSCSLGVFRNISGPVSGAIGSASGGVIATRISRGGPSSGSRMTSDAGPIRLHHGLYLVAQPGAKAAHARPLVTNFLQEVMPVWTAQNRLEWL